MTTLSTTRSLIWRAWPARRLLTCLWVLGLLLTSLFVEAQNGPFCNTFTKSSTRLSASYDIYAVGDTVYAGTEYGLAISTDGGTTFSLRTTDNGLGSNGVGGVYAIGSRVYAATQNGLAISTDGGDTFINRTTANGLGNYVQNEQEANRVNAVYAEGNTVYAATNEGVCISTDGGNTFTRRTISTAINRTSDVYAVGSTIYVATGVGLLISPNGGRSFAYRTYRDGLANDNLYSVFAVGDTVYAGTQNGLSISTNGGVSFTTRNITGGLSESASDIYAVGSTVYVALGFGGGLGISTDGGNSFTRITEANGLGSNDARGVFATSTKIYVASVGPLFGEPVGGISFCSTTCSTTVSISAAPSLTVSQGQSATLTAAGATSYQWSTGATTESIEVSQAGIYSVTGTTGACSATASASLSVLPGADLTPVVYLRPFNLYGTSAVSVVVSVYELNGVAASGPITVKLSKDPKFSLSLPSMESSVGGVPVQNSQWTLAPPETDPDYYVLTTNAVLSGGGELSFGLTGNFTSGSTSGQAILTAVVEPQSGEANVSNNVDSERASYFQK